MTDRLILPTNGAELAAVPPPVPPPNYNIAPEGVVIHIPLTPTTGLTHVIPAQTMHEIVKKWREVERGNEGMRKLALDVMRTKQ
jgi:hypothetical protein